MKSTPPCPVAPALRVRWIRLVRADPTSGSFGANVAVTNQEGSVDVQRAVVRHHRRHLHRDAAHRAADRRAGLGCARRCPDRAERRGGHRVLRASRPRRHSRWNRRRSCVRSAPQARRRAWLAPPRAFRSRTSPSTPRWLSATIHHWQDPIAGLREMRRVARRVVVFTHDTSDPGRFWLTRDYLPEVAGLVAPAGLR